MGFLSNTGDAAWAVDLAQRIIYWNEAAEKMFGYRADEVIGSQCHQTLCGQLSPSTPLCYNDCQIIQKSKIQEPTTSCNCVVKHVNGTLLPINLSTLFVQGGEEDLKSVITIHFARLLNHEILANSRLKICLLGSTSVWRDQNIMVNSPLWKRSKARAFFAYLALHRGQYIHRDTLIDILWPNKPHESALRNLNTAVYNVRRSLEPSLKRGSESRYIQFERGCYYMNDSQEIWLDVEHFEKYIHHARIQQQPTEIIKSYQKAINLYQSDLLSDLGNNFAWLAPERARLRELYIMILEKLGIIFDKQGKEEEAIIQFQKVLNIRPWQETVCQYLMRLYLRQGLYVAAAKQYINLAAALKTELNIMPSHETQRLYRLSRNGR
ncbi:MAG: PAS domain S-box protein [Chloroflexi bacterium]|nr:MAG: PAS domain S-box protein [Chloroflexota bacterium]